MDIKSWIWKLMLTTVFHLNNPSSQVSILSVHLMTDKMTHSSWWYKFHFNKQNIYYQIITQLRLRSVKGWSCHSMTRSHACTYYDFNQWQIHHATGHKKYINTVQNEKKEKIISQCIILDKWNSLLSTTCIVEGLNQKV